MRTRVQAAAECSRIRAPARAAAHPVRDAARLWGVGGTPRRLYQDITSWFSLLRSYEAPNLLLTP